jgi:hypothetical protein
MGTIRRFAYVGTSIEIHSFAGDAGVRIIAFSAVIAQFKLRGRQQ